jgi:hypothetical protein
MSEDAQLPASLAVSPAIASASLTQSIFHFAGAPQFLTWRGYRSWN